MCSRCLEPKEAVPSFLPGAASVINPAVTDPEKYPRFEEIRVREMGGKLVPFQSTEGSLLTATLRLFFFPAWL